MKWHIVLAALLTLAALLLLVPAIHAAGPEPVQYALVKCSGLPLDFVVSGEQAFDTQYGFDHSLITAEQWRSTYVTRVNEFAHAVGCPAVLADDDTPAGTLTFWSKLYVPVYQAIWTHGVFP